MTIALLVCDLQPDFMGKIDDREVLLDRIFIALQAARHQGLGCRTFFTGVRFSTDYKEVSEDHKVFGALKRVYQVNRGIKWFTDGKGSEIETSLDVQPNETVLYRQQLFPFEIEKVLDGVSKVVVVGIKASTTIIHVCQSLCDACIPVVIILECLADETREKCEAVVQHVLPTVAESMSLSEFIEFADASHTSFHQRQTSKIKYFSDCGRGGHLSIFASHLLLRGYHPWPTQCWYQEPLTGKSYQCPVGRCVVDICDEPQFSRTSLFVSGREHLDEKDKLLQLVPHLLPPTFTSLEDAAQYAENTTGGVWFVKEADKNGGRAVKVVRSLSECRLEPDTKYVIQPHLPNPLLFERRKCHVKSYQYISCDESGNWDLFLYKTAFLPTADKAWVPDDTSPEVQISSLRNRRLPENDPWSIQHSVSIKYRGMVCEIVQKAIEKGLLKPRPGKKQFEIFSADFMLDQDDRMYLIECNFTPVMYDPHGKQELTTRGLRSYAELYRNDPENAVVNDHEMVRDALALAFGDEPGPNSQWERVLSVPSC